LEALTGDGMNVAVEIHEPGTHNESTHVECDLTNKAVPNRGDLAAVNKHVCNRIQIGAGIHDSATLEHQ
jgi:hypothetical protein